MELSQGKRWRVRPSWAVVALLVSVVLGTWVADGAAATLMVKGPRGTVVLLDGSQAGVLPLDAPIPLDPGTYSLRCELPGYSPHEEVVDVVDENDDLTITVSMLQKKRSTAALYSLVLAGLGQHYQGHHKRGWTLMGIQVAAVLAAVYGENQFKQHRSDFEDAYRLYQDSIDGTDIAGYRDEANAAYAKMEDAERVRNTALWMAAATGVFAAVEAWIAHPQVVARTVDPRVGPLSSSDPTLQLGWRLGF
jgi:hypothetical protein